MPSKHTTEKKAKKKALLIRPLVLKLPIDFHCGRLWASDLLRFRASTKAKLSHLEGRSAFRDSGSAHTPAANLFPSGVFSPFFPLFHAGRAFQDKRFDCWRFYHIIPIFLPYFPPSIFVCSDCITLRCWQGGSIKVSFLNWIHVLKKKRKQQPTAFLSTVRVVEVPDLRLPADSS